jgi:hypothetical protein
MVSQDDLPTGNLHLTKRTYLLLRRDYFYTESTRPTGENPLFLSVTGYLAIAVLGLAILWAIFQGFGLYLPGVGLLLLPLLGLFFVFFALHAVFSITSLLWRLGRVVSSGLS